MQYQRRKKKHLKRGRWTLSILLLALTAFLGISEHINHGSKETTVLPDEIQVHILDVGQGLSVFIKAGDDTLLYDGGDWNAAPSVISYLQKEGVKVLDYCIASHYDADHLSGIVDALDTFEVDTLIAPNYECDTATYRAFLREADENDLKLHFPIASESFAFGNGSLEILAPLGTGYENENDYSVVVKLTVGDSSLLLTGDATSVSEEEMLKANTDLDCDVLVLGHHGSYSSNGQAFYRAVSPEYAVISCAQNNDYGHPHTRIMNLLREENTPLYRTDLQGTICFTMTAENITFELEPCKDYATGDDIRYRNYSAK